MRFFSNIVVLIIFTLNLLQLLKANGCSKNGIYCLNPNEFHLCINIDSNNNGGMLVGPTLNCPKGTYCNANNKFPCSSETPLTTTTTIAPVTEPSCNGPSKHPGPKCDQYYECSRKLWWYELVLKTCNNGLAFNPTTSGCESAEKLNCKIIQ